MSEDPSSDFFIALGQEFCEALSPPVPDDLITPQDAYEVWIRAFSRPPSPRLLSGLTVAHLSHLREECERYFECPSIRVEQVESAVARTLARWPVIAS